MSVELDTSAIETRLFIGGKFVNSVSGKTFPVVDPSNEKVICHVQEADAADVDLAVAAARAAFKTGSPWRSTEASGRRDLMLKLAALIERDQDYFIKLESLDNGKPMAADFSHYGSAIDMHLVKDCFKYYAGWADKITGKTMDVGGNQFAYTSMEAVGVCGMIIPWNFPLLMLTWKIAPALAAGCTMVLKSSEKTPLSALHFAKLVIEAGFPEGTVNILSGFGPTAGAALSAHMDVDAIKFTGSTAVGKKIMVAAANSNLKKCSLELGGKSPLIVFDDADLEQAVAVAQAGLFLNQGQVCCASSRLFVQDTIYDAFVKRTVEEAEKRTIGGPMSGSVQGPQVDDIQFKNVLGYIEKGKAEGASCLTGGERHGELGYYVKPTVFGDVTDEMTIAKEEIFGPVMSILKFSTVEEAIERANNTIYGLAAGVCTRDIGKALKVTSQLRAGTCWINTFNSFSAQAPFGGYGQSGLGRDLGEYALDNYMEVKTVIVPMDILAAK